MHLFVLERALHGDPAGLVARYKPDPDPRKFSEGENLFQRTLQHIVLHWAEQSCSLEQQSSIPGLGRCYMHYMHYMHCYMLVINVHLVHTVHSAVYARAFALELDSLSPALL